MDKVARQQDRRRFRAKRQQKQSPDKGSIGPDIHRCLAVARPRWHNLDKIDGIRSVDGPGDAMADGKMWTQRDR